jgi:hypothetical protein
MSGNLRYLCCLLLRNNVCGAPAIGALSIRVIRTIRGLELLFLAELLESWIAAQRVPDQIEP